MKAYWVSSSRLERVLAGRYPFGIARRMRPAPTADKKKRDPAVLFFVAMLSDSRTGTDVFSGPQGELLNKAVVQALNWSRNEIELHFVYSDAEARKKGSDKDIRLRVSERLRQSIAEARPRAVVALGDEVASLLELPLKPLSAALDKRTLERDGISFIVTADLAEVMGSADVKRMFWTDLKSLSTRFKK